MQFIVELPVCPLLYNTLHNSLHSSAVHRKSERPLPTPEEVHHYRRELHIMCARKRECRAEDERMRLAGEIAELEYNLGRMERARK